MTTRSEEWRIYDPEIQQKNQPSQFDAPNGKAPSILFRHARGGLLHDCTRPVVGSDRASVMTCRPQPRSMGNRRRTHGDDEQLQILITGLRHRMGTAGCVSKRFAGSGAVHSAIENLIRTEPPHSQLMSLRRQDSW
jgi:hypothetical protein